MDAFLKRVVARREMEQADAAADRREQLEQLLKEDAANNSPEAFIQEKVTAYARASAVWRPCAVCGTSTPRSGSICANCARHTRSTRERLKALIKSYKNG